MVKIINNSDYTTVIQLEIDNRLFKTSEQIVFEWNSIHSYEDRIELSDVFDYVFENSDLNDNENYIIEYFKKTITNE